MISHRKKKKFGHRAIELNPEYTIAYSNRGNIYSELEKFDEALRDYNRAIELGWKRHLPRYNIVKGDEDIDILLEIFLRTPEP